MKKYILIVFFLLINIQGFSQTTDNKYNDALKIIEVWLEAQVAYENLPGISASIVLDQKKIWSNAYGLANVEKNIKMNTETLCSICSISKLFTSIAIMKLYDEGKLRLDDKIDDILPWYDLEQQFSNSAPITIRSLLTHSSGIPRENTYSHWNGDYKFPSKKQIKTQLSTQKTIYPVSTNYQYSNLAFTLLGYVIEEITSDTYENYIQKNIIEELGLGDTRTKLPQSIHGKELAIGYSSKIRHKKRKPLSHFDANGVTAAAGFSSNVEDLAKFISWQFKLRKSTSTKVLKPSTLKDMHNVHWTNPNWRTTQGLGFRVWKGAGSSKWIGHDGYCPGYQSIVQLNTKTKLGYSVMINANGIDINKYVYGMNTLIKKVRSSKQNKNKELNLDQYIGYYEWEIANETYVATWGENLAIIELPSNSPGDSMRLFKHIKEDNFRRINEDGTLGESLTFERNAKGEIHRYKLFNNWLYEKIKP